MLARVLKTLLIAAAYCVGASALGLAFNALRPARIPLVAPFGYQQDCPDKIDLSAPTVTVAQALALVARRGGAVFVDARPEEDHRAFHLPGARSMPLSFSTPPGLEQVKPLAGSRLVIVYCDSPEDRIAKLQAERLREAGLARVTVLAGGVAAYRAHRARGAAR